MHKTKTRVLSIFLLIVLTITLTACSNVKKESVESSESPKEERIIIWKTDDSEVGICVDPKYYITDNSLTFYAYWWDENYKHAVLQVYALEIDGTEYLYREGNDKYWSATTCDQPEVWSSFNRLTINKDFIEGAENISFKEAESIRLIAGVYDSNLNFKEHTIDYIPNKLTIKEEDDSSSINKN